MSFYSQYSSDFRANIRLAWPIILGQLGQVSVNIVDNLMVGQLGDTALASVSLAVSLFIIFLVVGIGISMGLQPLVAAADANDEVQRVSYTFKHSLLINLVFAFLSVALVEIGLPLMEHMGQQPGVVEGARPYLVICIWSLIPMMAFQALRGLFEGLSSTMAPMLAMLAGNALNVLLNYMLIYGNWGAPELGVTGAAWGSLASRVLMLVMLILLAYRWKRPTDQRIWTYLQRINLRTFSIDYTRKVLNLGIPTSLQMLFEVSAFAVAAIMMGWISEDAQAAHQITINAVSATFMVCVGLSVAATVRVGNAYGKADKPAMRKAGFAPILQAIGFMSITAVLLTLFRAIIPTFYIEDYLVIEIASELFLIAAIFQISDGIQVTAIGALRGMQDIWWPTLITFFSYMCVGLPFSWWSTFEYGLGYPGIWFGLLLGLSLSAVLNTWRFFKLSALRH